MDARRRHRLPLSALATAIVASLAIAAPSAQAANCTGADQLPLLASIAGAKAATLCLLNEQRAAHGVAPLSSEPTLESAATGYARTMVEQQFFGHVSPTGGTVEERLASYISGTGGQIVAENLGWGQGVLGTPSSIVNGWMRSQIHRENILQATFDQVGVGIATGAPVRGLLKVGATYAAEFGSREGGGATAPTRTSASSVAVNVTPGPAPTLKTISAKAKRRISTQCHAVARRTKASARTRRARYDRCVRTRTREARNLSR